MNYLSNLIFSILPPRASSVAESVDVAFEIITGISIIAFLLVEGALIYLIFKYRRKSGEEDRQTLYITHSTKLEIIWTTIPAIILLVVFWYGMISYVELRTIPKDAINIEVIGKKWQWDIRMNDPSDCIFDDKRNKEWCIEFHTGKKEPLVFEKGKKYVLTMRSKDVIHSFFIPAFRIKQDVVPGLITRQWFQPIQTGVFNMFCTEYCGAEHSGMIGKVRVLDSVEFAEWKSQKMKFLQSKADRPLTDVEKQMLAGEVNDQVLIAKGEEIFNQQGCMACHRIDGTRLIAPPLNNLYGRQEKIQGLGVITVDDAYIKESIRNPSAKVVEGYPPAMSPYPESKISNEQLDALVAYLKSL